MAKRRTSTRGSTVVPLVRGQLVPSTYAAAVDRYLTAAWISPSSARVYRVSLTTWCWLFAGDTPPTGSARRTIITAADRAGRSGRRDPDRDGMLAMNIEDLDLPNKRGRVISKGGAIEWVHWQSGAVQLLPRLIAGRTQGPVFLTDRQAPTSTPSMDICPITGRARLSYLLREH